jgi:hypothetical protein
VIKFRNATDDTRNVGSDGPVVKKDEILEVDGEVVQETDDAYIVELAGTKTVTGFEDPDEAGYAKPKTEPQRVAYPKSTWHLAGASTRRATAATTRTDTNADTTNGSEG